MKLCFIFSHQCYLLYFSKKILTFGNCTSEADVEIHPKEGLSSTNLQEWVHTVHDNMHLYIYTHAYALHIVLKWARANLHAILAPERGSPARSRQNSCASRLFFCSSTFKGFYLQGPNLAYSGIQVFKYTYSAHKNMTCMLICMTTTKILCFIFLLQSVFSGENIQCSHSCNSYLGRKEKFLWVKKQSLWNQKSNPQVAIPRKSYCLWAQIKTHPEATRKD